MTDAADIHVSTRSVPDLIGHAVPASRRFLLAVELAERCPVLAFDHARAAANNILDVLDLEHRTGGPLFDVVVAGTTIPRATVEQAVAALHRYE